MTKSKEKPHEHTILGRLRANGAIEPVVPLMSVAQAATMLCVTERWVRERQMARELPYVKLGALVRFRRSDLQAYISACHKKAM